MRWFRFILMAAPVAFVMALAWWGVATFVNAYTKLELDFSSETWSAVMVSFMVGLLFWQLTSSELIARFGRRRVISAALLTPALFYALIWMTTDFYLICMLLFMLSFSTAVALVAWMPMVACAGGTTPGRALAINQIVSTSVSVVVIFAGGPWVQDRRFGLLFPIFAGLIVMAVVMFFFASKHFEDRQAPRPISLRQITRAQWREMLRGPILLILAFGFFAEPFNFQVINQLFPNLGREHLGMNELVITRIVAFGRLPALLSLFFMARYVDRFNAVLWYGAAVTVTALAVIGMGMVSSVGQATVVYVLYYLGYGLIWACNATSMNSVVPPQLRESAFALAGVSVTAGMVLAGVAQKQLQAFGVSLPNVFMYCGAVGLFAGVMLSASGLRLGRRGREEVEPG